MPVELKDRCTGMYVGRHVSVEGTTLLCRSDDGSSGVSNKIIQVVPAKNEKGQRIYDLGEKGRGFYVELPRKTYKYTRMYFTQNIDDGQFFACCTNECGLAVTGTVTTEPCKEYKKIDPTKPRGQGIHEAIVDAIPAACARNAREGAEILAKYIDKYGSAETHSITFSDPQESWMIELYGGHSYCAQKMPDDCVAVYGNHNMFGWFDLDSPTDGKDYFFSDNLKDYLDKLSNPVRDKQGRYHLARSIEGPLRSNGSNLRDWRGHSIFAPSSAPDYSRETFFPLFYKPDRKISVLDVMKLYADRLEGTKFDKNKPGNKRWRPIGVTRQEQAYILQTFHNLPKRSCHVQWTAPSTAEFSVFVPFFSGITKVPKTFEIDDIKHYYAINDSFCYSARQVSSTAGTDRQYLGAGVQQFVWLQDKLMLNQIMQEASRVKTAFSRSIKQGESYVNKLFADITRIQLANIKQLYDQVAFCQMYNFNDRMCRARNKKFVPVASVRDIVAYTGCDAVFTKRRPHRKLTLKKGKAQAELVENTEECIASGKHNKLYSGLIYLNGKPYISLDVLDFLQ